jgi:hypothetical protein
MSCDVVLQQLDERSAAYRAEAERLRAEAERIKGLLAVCEAELDRLVTARQVVGELPAVHAAAVPDRPPLPTPRTGSAECASTGRMRPPRSPSRCSGCWPAMRARCGAGGWPRGWAWRSRHATWSGYATT